MKLEDMSKEELSSLSYTDLTEIILKENKKSMNTPSIFRIICDLLDYTDNDYTAKVGDYYTSLTTDRRFLLLESAEWDLRDNHIIPLVIEDDEEIEDIINDEDEDEDEDDDIEEDEEDIDSLIDDDLDENEEEIEDLSIVSEEEIEES